MNIRGIFLPNWLLVLLLGILALIAYFAVPPVSSAVNGVIDALFGPLIDSIRQAMSLEVI